MMVTQDGRLLNIRTSLGKDVLLLSSFTAEEEISGLFKITAELLHEGAVGGSVPHVVDPAQILGTGVCIEILQRDGSKRFFHGMVNRLEQRNRDVRFTHYQVEIVPQIWLLSQIHQSRIFQDMSVPDIVKKVLGGISASLELSRTYKRRNYCVQYRESDLDFISRLMEEEGIFYYFKHEETNHKLIITDVPSGHADCPTKSTVSFDLNQSSSEEDFVSIVREWTVNYRLQSGKVTLWDHNFELPYNRLDASKSSQHPITIANQLEIYDYPGGYSQKYDGISKSGGEQASELQNVFADRDATVANQMEGIDSRYKVATGVGNCCSFTSGHKFTLTDHPDSSTNGQYVLTSVSHSAMQSPDYASEDVVLDPYDNAFNCIRVGAGSPSFRPEPRTPRPFIQGTQSAVVVGPSGEEIFTDKYGRVKVQFRWDRHGTADAGSSCWVRVAQSWAGKNWGTMFIPRIGMEVIVDFIEGDPDRPIIIGCVYNADTMPPYTLPGEMTKSTIKTNSSKGGGGFNELRFEDKKGSEQIFIHAQKNQDIRVKNTVKETIGKDRHLIVQGEQFERVDKDKHLTIKGNQNEKVNGSVSLTCGGSQQVKTGTKYAMEAGQEVHVKAGMTAVIEAGTSLTLKVGGNFININPGGVFVKGTMVMLNSGGAAGSGSGSNPTEPKDVKEAVTAEAGSKPTGLTSKTPPVPPQFQALTTAVQGAVQNRPSSTVPILPVTMPTPSTLPNFAGLLGTAFAAATSAVQNAVQQAVAQAAKAADVLVDTVSDVKDIAAEMVGTASNVAENLIDRAEAAVDAVQQMAEEAKDTAEAVADQVVEQVEAVVDTAQSAAEVVVDTAVDTARDAAETAVDAAEAAVDTAESAADAAVDAATEAADAAADAAGAALDAIPFM